MPSHLALVALKVLTEALRLLPHLEFTPAVKTSLPFLEYVETLMQWQCTGLTLPLHSNFGLAASSESASPLSLFKVACIPFTLLTAFLALITTDVI